MVDHLPSNLSLKGIRTLEQAHRLISSLPDLAYEGRSIWGYHFHRSDNSVTQFLVAFDASALVFDYTNRRRAVHGRFRVPQSQVESIKLYYGSEERIRYHLAAAFIRHLQARLPDVWAASVVPSDGKLHLDAPDGLRQVLDLKAHGHLDLTAGLVAGKGGGFLVRLASWTAGQEREKRRRLAEMAAVTGRRSLTRLLMLLHDQKEVEEDELPEVKRGGEEEEKKKYPVDLLD